MADAKPNTMPDGREASPMPRVFTRGSEVFANSRDVAVFFEKDHRNVLRDIDHLIQQEPSLAQGGLLNFEQTPHKEGLRNFAQTLHGRSAPKFGETPYVELQNGQTYRAFEMTRDGFALLAMGFTGPRALKWKLRYIEAFNLMEAELQARPEEKPKGLFDFDSLEFIEHEDRLWLTGQEISRGLGCRRPHTAAKIYLNHKSEFTEDMTTQFKTANVVGRSIRVFSLLGAHMLVMRSHAPRAAAFRVWLLDQMRAAEPETKQKQGSLRSDNLDIAADPDTEEEAPDPEAAHEEIWGFPATQGERILNDGEFRSKEILTQPEQAGPDGMIRWKLSLETVREARRIWSQEAARILWRRLDLPVCENAAPMIEAAFAPARRQPLDLVRDVLWKLDDGRGVRRSDLNYRTTQIRGPAREAALEELERRGEITRKKMRGHDRGYFAEWIFVVQRQGEGAA